MNNNMTMIDEDLELLHESDSWWKEQAEEDWEMFCLEVGLEELLEE